MRAVPSGPTTPQELERASLPRRDRRAALSPRHRQPHHVRKLVGRHHRSGVRGTAAAGPHQADPLWAAHRHAAVGGRQRRVPRRPAGGCTRGDRPLRTNSLAAPHSHSTAASTSRRCVRASPPETPRARPLRRRRTSSTGGTCAGGTRGPTLWRRLSSRASSTSDATRACGDRRSSSPPACSATTTARRSSRALMCPRCSRAESSTRRRPTPRGEI